MGRIAKDFRRIKWRDVVTKKIMGSLKCRPGRINNECAKAKKHQQRPRPPDIGAHCFAKGTSRQFDGSGHSLRIMARAATLAQTEHRLPACVRPADIVSAVSFHQRSKTPMGP